MTNKEAIEVLNMFLYKDCDLARTKFAYDENTVWEAVHLATKIVDRLEHMDENPKISSEDATIYDKLYDDGFAEGYNYACMVMRGDLEETLSEVIETLEEMHNED